MYVSTQKLASQANLHKVLVYDKANEYVPSYMSTYFTYVKNL